MSLNKVLNRPMFRREALRKGHLKTINAQTGIMVGQPTTGAPVPALRKPPTFMERMSVSTPARFLASGISIPSIGGYYAGDKVAQGLGIEDPLGRTAFGLGGSYLATKALPGLASLPAATSAALMAGPAYLMYAGNKERKRIAKMNPAERAAHRQKSMQFGTEGYLTDNMFQQQFGGFKPKPIEQKVAEDRVIIKGQPGSGRVGFGKKKTEEQLKQEGDQLLSDNVVTSDNVANLDTVQENSINMRPDVLASKDPQPSLPDAKVTTEEDKNQKEEDNKQTQNEINVGGISNDADFNKTIALAKKYYDEVYEGRGSQANLVFLANLASGLLTGTTRKSGIGGAMEVLGQALGPAVNNFATIKLKEGELRQNAREASLNAALDHMKFVNDNVKAERPDQTGGIVQIRGADGRLRNFKAYQMKDGTITMAAGIVDGRESFVPISQGAPIKDSGPDGIPGNEDDRVIGNFENFLEQKNVDKRLFDIQDILGNRYNALSVTRDVLKTLNQLDESGDPVKAGAALSVDQFTRRLMGVSKELFGFEVSGLSLDQLEQKVAELQADEYAAIDRSDLSDAAKEEAKKKLDSKNLIKQAKDKLKSRGLLSGLSREEQEKLAVQETTLVYALANTFKDQDRLTQRDIDAARNIVNIFSLTRSSKDVKASIEAIGRQLEADIRRQESLYTTAGGLETTLQDLRRLKNFEVFEGTVSQQLTSDLGVEDIKKELEKMEL